MWYFIAGLWIGAGAGFIIAAIVGSGKMADYEIKIHRLKKDLSDAYDH